MRSKVLAAISGFALFLCAAEAIADTYSIYVTWISGPCYRAANTEYVLTVNGGEVAGRSEAGSGFKTTIASDGSFNASFESYFGRVPMHAEGNVKQGQRTLKIIDVMQGCVFEGKDAKR